MPRTRIFRRIMMEELEPYHDAGWRVATRPYLEGNTVIVEKYTDVVLKKKTRMAMITPSIIFYGSIEIVPPAGWLSILTEAPTVTVA